MNRPLFSIIIPVHNREACVERALDSIAAQTYRPVQLVLVDNSSSDSSVEVMRSWKSHNEDDDLEVLLIHEPQPGPAAARQAGLETAAGEYIAFLDSDDSFCPEALTCYAEVFARTGADLVTTDTQLHTLNGRAKRLSIRNGALLLNQIHHSIIYTMSFAARKNLLERVGGWNRELRIWEDWELGLRLLISSPKCAHTGVITADKYESEVSVSGLTYSEKYHHYEDTLKAVEKSALALPQPASRTMLFLMEYRRIMLAALFTREGRKDLGEPLRRKVLARNHGTDKMLLRMAYAYISRGGRGFDRLLSIFRSAGLRDIPPA